MKKYIYKPYVLLYYVDSTIIQKRNINNILTERRIDMPWDLDSDRPIFMQIVERIELDIISGKYKSGDKMPTVRELAVEAAVNPNTMQKAYAELERKGLVYSQRTSGRFVTEDKKLLERTRKEYARKEVASFMKKMLDLGLSKEEIINLLK